MKMKRIFLLMISLVAVALVALAAPPPCSPHTGMADPDERDIPVYVVSSPTKPPTPAPTADPGDFIKDLIDGPRLCVVDITLAGTPYNRYFRIECGPNDLGISYVEMENLSTGEKTGTHLAQAGAVSIPISSPRGRWWVVIKSASGGYFSGTFFVDVDW